MTEEIVNGEENCKEHLAVKDRLNILVGLVLGVGVGIFYQTFGAIPDLEKTVIKSQNEISTRITMLEAQSKEHQLSIDALRMQRNLDHPGVAGKAY